MDKIVEEDGGGGCSNDRINDTVKKNKTINTNATTTNNSNDNSNDDNNNDNNNSDNNETDYVYKHMGDTTDTDFEYLTHKENFNIERESWTRNLQRYIECHRRTREERSNNSHNNDNDKDNDNDNDNDYDNHENSDNATLDKCYYETEEDGEIPSLRNWADDQRHFCRAWEECRSLGDNGSGARGCRWLMMRKKNVNSDDSNNDNDDDYDGNGKSCSNFAFPPEERMEMMREANFLFDGRPDKRWFQRLEELKRFKSQFGHVDVPTTPQQVNKINGITQYCTLGMWLTSQRHDYRNLESANPMTQRKINELEHLGVKWNPLDDAWHLRLDELKQYTKKFGHGNIPRNDVTYSSLSRWIRNQRDLKKLGKLQPHREMILLGIMGLDWKNYISTSSSSTSSSSSFTTITTATDANYYSRWDAKLNDLRGYKNQNGNCRVPKKYPKNIQLGTWVRNQRCQYRSYKIGKKSTMTPERISMLEEVDFEWDVYPKRAVGPRSRKRGNVHVEKLITTTATSASVSNPATTPVATRVVAKRRGKIK